MNSFCNTICTCMVMQIKLVVVVVVVEFSYLRINCLRKGGNLDIVRSDYLAHV